MQDFRPGQTVKVPCAVEPGAFPGEHLVTIEIDGDRISGFVRKEFIREEYVLATILKVESSGILLKIAGSFFKIAAGRMSVSPDWATAHLLPVVA